MASLSLQDVRSQFDILLNRLRDDPEHPLVVTQEAGEPAFVVLAWAQYESLVETLGLRDDETLTEDIRRGAREIEEGQTLSTEEAWRQLGW